MSKHNLIVIRADASLQMGTGHIMRCLTLAESLKVNNYAVVFITRSHPGNIIDLIEKKGFTAYSLEGAKLSDNTLSLQDPYASWLGATQEDDANACLPILKSLCPEWLVVGTKA
jgi:UDP:flavonoid glycosyltransferase YjiC (YdhE family)